MVSFAGSGIADAKVHAPVPPATFVRRSRMQVRVEEATADAAVTTLRAHAGAGKTALLADWARTGSTATAWVSLDPTDNGVGRLWAAVARAVAVRVPEMAEALEGWGAVDPRRSLTPSDLVAVLDALPEELRLVLDDVHELVALERLDELETFIRYRPAHLRLVLAGRSMPPLPWPRLRLQVGVIDLRGEDLRFSRSEAASLISRHGARMTRAQVEQVHATTGGWAAALCLTTIAARRSPDMGDFLADPSRAEEAVAGYLRDEVLDPLPAADRTVLRDLSVCDPVPPSLVTDLSRPGRVPRARAPRARDVLAHHGSPAPACPDPAPAAGVSVRGARPVGACPVRGAPHPDGGVVRGERSTDRGARARPVGRRRRAGRRPHPRVGCAAGADRAAHSPAASLRHGRKYPRMVIFRPVFMELFGPLRIGYFSVIHCYKSPP